MTDNAAQSTTSWVEFIPHYYYHSVTIFPRADFILFFKTLNLSSLFPHHSIPRRRRQDAVQSQYTMLQSYRLRTMPSKTSIRYSNCDGRTSVCGRAKRFFMDTFRKSGIKDRPIAAAAPRLTYSSIPGKSIVAWFEVNTKYSWVPTLWPRALLGKILSFSSAAWIFACFLTAKAAEPETRF